jgi:hypothetical protein
MCCVAAVRGDAHEAPRVLVTRTQRICRACCVNGAGCSFAVGAATARRAVFDGIENIVVGSLSSGTLWQQALAERQCCALAARVHVMAETAGNPFMNFAGSTLGGTLIWLGRLPGCGLCSSALSRSTG